MTMQNVVAKIDEIQSFTNKAGKNLNKHDIQLREHADRILAMEQGGSYSPPPPASNQKSIAGELSNSNEVQSFLEKKTHSAGMSLALNKVLPDIQNNTTISAPATNPAQVIPGVLAAPEQKTFLRQLFTSVPASSSSFTYTKETAFTNNAEAQNGEGTLKAESDITYEEVTKQIATYAHWLKISRQNMADNPAIVDFKTRRLSYGLELKIEDAMINGDGTAGKMSGLLDTGNFTAFVPTIADTAIDSVRKAKLALENNDYMAGLIIMNHNDVSDIELLKDADGEYIVGKPIDGGLRTLWGTPLYSCKSVAAGTFIILDTVQAVSVHVREEALLQLSNSDGTDFTKNLVTMLVEARIDIAVHLPAGVISGALTV